MGLRPGWEGGSLSQPWAEEMQPGSETAHSGQDFPSAVGGPFLRVQLER